MTKRAVGLIALAVLVLAALVSCTEILVVEVGDCEFYVSDETPLTLTADTVRYCAGYIQVTLVEFQGAGQ